MCEPRKHHYLPQFYLRGFSANGKNLRQIEKQTLRSYTCAIKDAAAIRDYHELDAPDFSDANALEKELSKVEGVLSVAVRQAITDGITTEEVHAKLAMFVAQMRLRVPAFKSQVEEQLRGIVRSSGLIMERKGKLPSVPKGLESALSMENLRIDISNWKCLELIFGLAEDKEIIGILSSMQPSILRAPEGKFFLTGDQPVSLFHPTATPHDAYGVGLADPLVEVSIPLSAKTLLLLTWDRQFLPDQVIEEEDVNEFNRRTVVIAESLVFASGDFGWAMELVTELKDSSAGWDTSFLDVGDSFFHVGRFKPVLNSQHY